METLCKELVRTLLDMPNLFPLYFRLLFFVTQWPSVENCVKYILVDLEYNVLKNQLN